MDTSFEDQPFQSILRYKQPANAPELAAAYRQSLLEAFDASAAGDSKPLWALFDPDVVFYVAACLPYGGIHRGIDATRKAHSIAHGCYDRARVEVEQIFFAADLAIAYLHLTFRVRRNGRTGSLPMCELYRFRGGKVVEWRALHFDAEYLAKLITANN
jgi:uncharacterized protein